MERRSDEKFGLDFIVGISASLHWRLFLQEVRRILPESIAELPKAVEGFAGTIPEEMLIDATQNVRNCAQACIEASGSHFALFFKLYSKYPRVQQCVPNFV